MVPALPSAHENAVLKQMSVSMIRPFCRYGQAHAMTPGSEMGPH